MTHNTPEAGIEEAIEEFVGQWRRSFGRVELDTGAHPKYVDRQENWLRTTLHQARQTWLRKEIGRLEGMKADVSESDSEAWGYSLLEEIGSCCPGDDAANVYEYALQTIIDRYQAELDQDITRRR